MFSSWYFARPNRTAAAISVVIIAGCMEPSRQDYTDVALLQNYGLGRSSPLPQ